MNASKENARKAKVALGELHASHGNPQAEFLRTFLDAAERKLPTEAAFKRDRNRRKKQAAG